MTPEKLFHELLGLGLNWEVIESRFERASGTVFLELRETPKLWELTRCPQEGSFVFCYDHTEVLTWRHLNVFQRRCEITCRLPRGKCRQCGRVFRVRPPWEGLSTHFTKEFEAFALLLMREMPMRKVAQAVGETDTRLWRMLFRQVGAAYVEADFSNVCCVGVDGMSVRKGHEYISVFADLVRKWVLFATEGKDQETWAKFVEALEKHNGHRHAITQVSMDISPAYQRGVADNCRHAQVVFDKFHVIKNANEAVDKLRRAEVRLGSPLPKPVALAQKPGALDGRGTATLGRHQKTKISAPPKPIKCGRYCRTSETQAAGTAGANAVGCSEVIFPQHHHF